MFEREKSKEFTWKLSENVDAMEKLLIIQKRILKEQTNLFKKQEKLFFKENIYGGENLSFIDIVDNLNKQKGIKTLSRKDYGRLMGTLADNYVKEFLSNELNMVFEEENRDGNESGYDLKTINGLRLQVKFRQYGGKNPYSRQIYFETTRRLSEKNLGDASLNGHVAYQTNEFDCVFLILCPNTIEGRNIKNWNYCCINVSEIKNEKNNSYVDTKIKSSVLKAGADWKYKLNKLDSI